MTVTSCLIYKVIRDLESIDHLSINPIRRIGLIHKWSIDFTLAQVECTSILVRGDRDSRADLMPIYGDLNQIKL